MSTHRTIACRKSGQVMILAVLALGGTILGATTIAGLLTIYQIRESSDVANTTRAIFAADTGIEWGFYQFFNPSSTQGVPVLSGGATFTTTCFVADVPDTCQNASTTLIRAVGTSGGFRRAFEVSF